MQQELSYSNLYAKIKLRIKLVKILYQLLLKLEVNNGTT